MRTWRHYLRNSEPLLQILQPKLRQRRDRAVGTQQGGKAALLLGNVVKCLQRRQMPRRDTRIAAQRHAERFDFISQFAEDVGDGDILLNNAVAPPESGS